MAQTSDRSRNAQRAQPWRALIWRDDKLVSDARQAQVKEALRDQKALVWLDAEGDQNSYAGALGQLCGLSPLIVDMLGDPFERAKLYEAGGRYYAAVHGLTFDDEAGTADTPKLDILFGPNLLITAHPQALPWLSTVRETTLTDPRPLVGRGVAFLLHAVLDALVDSYFPVLDEIDGVIDDLEDLTVQDTSNAVQGRIFRIKRSLALMRRVISPQVELFNSIVTRGSELIPDEARPYFADVHDHLVRSFEVLDSYRDLMSGLLDVYLTTVSNRLNVVMKQLTIYAVIFMPITFITGIFGQNFGHSPQVEHDGGYNFWIVLAIMAAISLAHIGYFRWKRWI
ncbi:MAG TPA: magnesium/cobalt transporter CorA [Ktedonobacterales bacterium]|jgi:magnesium transporter